MKKRSLSFVPIFILMVLLISSSCKSGASASEKDGPQLAMVDQEATKETKALYANLLKYKDQAVLFGHQDDLAYGIGWWAGDFRSDVQLTSGKFPAVFGWDAGEIGQKNNIDSVLFSDMQKWIIEVYKRGGINTLSWHLDNPLTGGDSWDQTAAVHTIIPGGELHEAFKETLDELAAFLEGLKTEDGTYVPVIFRPWHELNGSWFWWGRGNCSVEDYKSLFRFTITYLRDVKGLHNLLYSYSTDKFSTLEEYMERWPGNEFVDLIGYDDYHNFARLESVPKGIRSLRILQALGQELNKPFALTETGLESIPEAEWFTKHVLEPIVADSLARQLTYFLVWRNFDTKHHYAPYPDHPAADDFRKFEKDANTWFLEDLPDYYSYEN